MRIASGFCLFALIVTCSSFAQDTNFSTGPQYLMNYGSPAFARSIATPSLSLTDPPLQVGATAATGGLTVGAENQTASSGSQPVLDSFPIYYGAAPAQLIEISGRENSSTVKHRSGALETGALQFTTPEALRERGIGVTLAEAAAYGRTHRLHSTRTYTNADIERLHPAN